MPATVLPAAYAQGVQAAGGHAVLLPPGDPVTAADAVARLDGIVLAGGEDLDPALYGAEPHPCTDTPVPARDRWEHALLAAALERDIPVLGICRGMQMMNVYAGGSLIQHLPDEVGHEAHNARPGVFAQHMVTTVPGTRTADLLPGATEVATHHHQAVGRLGAGLTVTARAEDGTVEAVEFTGRSFALGVQWHPEMNPDTRPLGALVSAARHGVSTAGAARHPADTAEAGTHAVLPDAGDPEPAASVPSRGSLSSVLAGSRALDDRATVTVDSPA